MREIKYVIKDKSGIHARPAGEFVKKSKMFNSSITVCNDDKKADGKKIFGLMGLGVKYNDEITVCIDGDDEEEAAKEIKEFLEHNC